MSQGVASHCGLYYRALPGGGVFLVKNVTGSIKAVVHYLSMTSCVSSKGSDCLHETSASDTVFNIHGSTAGFSFSSAKRNILLNQNQALYLVSVSYTFTLTNIFPMGRRIALPCLLMPKMHIFFCERKPQRKPTLTWQEQTPHIHFKPTDNHWTTTCPSNILSTNLLKIVKEYLKSTGSHCYIKYL